jgi:DNA polymerase-1
MIFAFDFETCGGETLICRKKGKPKVRLEARKAIPKLVSYATGDGECGLLAPDEWQDLLLPILADPDIVKVGHNLAYDLGVIRAQVGRRVSAVNLFDTQLANQLLIAGLYPRSLAMSSLKTVAKVELNLDLDKSLQTSDWSKPFTDAQMEYSLTDSKVLIPLYHSLKAKLEEAGLARVAEIEFACIPLTVETAYTGLPIDVEALREKISSLSAEIAEKEKQLAKIARNMGWESPNKNRKFNSTSPQHLKALLQIAYPDEEVPGANEGVIKYLTEKHPDEPLAGMIKDLKTSKTQIGFLISWLKDQENGRLYSEWIQLGTMTGRYTSKLPNAQQIDKKLRYLFKASAGNALVEVDYKNIELRLAAEISKEPTLLALYQAGADVHKATAAKVFGVPEDQVTPEQRKTAKIINFGALYGGGPHYLMEELPNLTKPEAEALLNTFQLTYPGLLRFWHECKRAPKVVMNGRKFSSVRSALGRREFVPTGITGKQRAKEKSRLLNVPIQSTGVDLFKSASGLLYQELCKPEHADFQFLVSLHDSVLLEASADRAKECAQLVERCFMQAASEIFHDAPCAADIKVGADWSFQGKTI